MEQEKIAKMWNIDSKLIMGEDITEKERQFYNDHLQEMQEEMYDDYNHWKDFCEKEERKDGLWYCGKCNKAY